MARWTIEIPTYGRVHCGYHAMDAFRAYLDAVRASCATSGALRGLSVLVFRDEELYREYVGRNDRVPTENQE